MKQQEVFYRALPGRFFLDEEDPGAIEMYLQEKGWIDPYEHVLSAERPYAGNLNHVLRIHTPRRTFLLKQARPWVEKHPQIPAPPSRAEAEAAFFKLVKEDPALSISTPQILGHDEQAHILMMEDAGAGKDYSWLYPKNTEFPFGEITHFAVLLSHLHGNVAPRNIQNHEMQSILHEQVFRSPYFASVATDTCPTELFAVMKMLRENHALTQEVEVLGNIFLESGESLVHGEYNPGSWLKTSRGLFIIDPDFCFKGRAEWDLGVMVAHLRLCGLSHQQIRTLLAAYHPKGDFSKALVNGFAGAEMIRRLCGQGKIHNLDMPLAEKSGLLNEAAGWILNPASTEFLS